MSFCIFNPKYSFFYLLSYALLNPKADKTPEYLWIIIFYTPIFYPISQQCCPAAEPNIIKESGLPIVNIFRALLAINSFAISI